MVWSTSYGLRYVVLVAIPYLHSGLCKTFCEIQKIARRYKMASKRKLVASPGLPARTYRSVRAGNLNLEFRKLLSNILIVQSRLQKPSASSRFEIFFPDYSLFPGLKNFIINNFPRLEWFGRPRMAFVMLF